jgi:hypothetical protein
MDPGGETDVQAQVRRARLCLGDELGREVETIHSVASFCQRQRDSSIPASDVEDTGLFREHCLERLNDLQIPVGLSSRCELVGSKGCVKPGAQPFGLGHSRVCYATSSRPRPASPWPAASSYESQSIRQTHV